MGREEGSGWGTHVCLWWIHFDIWQNQYNIVKLKNKIKFKKIKNTCKENSVFTKLKKNFNLLLLHQLNKIQRIYIYIYIYIYVRNDYP